MFKEWGGNKGGKWEAHGCNGLADSVSIYQASLTIQKIVEKTIQDEHFQINYR